MIAYGALLAWPLVALILYMTLPAGRATIWTILGGYLVLPVIASFNFPGVPALDKTTIPNLCALVLAPLSARQGTFRWPRSTTVNLLLLLFVLSPFATAFTNPDPIQIGTFTLPGLNFREGLAFAVGVALQAVPFVLGAALLGNEQGHRDILKAFVGGGVVYSILILMELRLSPFLQTSLYGVSQFGYFLQQLRDGGYRSMAFLGHGLLVSTFIAMALLSAIGLARTRQRMFGMPMAALAAYLALILVLNKSLGAVIMAVLLALPLIFMSQRRFLTLVLGVALLIVAYPAVRSANLLPYQAGIDLIQKFKPDRAESLNFRLKNEDILLERAKLRPWFGWGSFGRNRVIVVTSWGSTADISITDGTWVITIGISGWAGYIAMFGLLTYPFWRAFKFRYVGLPTATVTLLAAHLLNIFDLIPNSSLRPITWLIAGSLAAISVSRRPARPRAAMPQAQREPDIVREPALQS